MALNTRMGKKVGAYTLIFDGTKSYITLNGKRITKFVQLNFTQSYMDLNTEDEVKSYVRGFNGEP